MTLLRKKGSLSFGLPRGFLTGSGMLNSGIFGRGSIGGKAGTGVPGEPIPPAGATPIGLLFALTRTI